MYTVTMAFKCSSQNCVDFIVGANVLRLTSNIFFFLLLDFIIFFFLLLDFIILFFLLLDFFFFFLLLDFIIL